MNYSEKNHCMDQRFGDISCRFLTSKTREILKNASITVKVLGGISFHVMAENWKHLTDTVTFSSFLVC